MRSQHDELLFGNDFTEMDDGFPCAEGRLDVDASLPPEPKEFDDGRLNHFGDCLRESIPPWVCE